MYSRTSRLVTRPPRPVPGTWERSTPCSWASIKTAGEYRCSAPRGGVSTAGGGTGAAGGGAAAGPGPASPLVVSATSAGGGAASPPTAPTPAVGTSAGSGAAPSSTSTTAISAPASTVWPSGARISLRMPVTGDGTSALTLSVSTSSMGSNSTTW